MTGITRRTINLFIITFLYIFFYIEFDCNNVLLAISVSLFFSSLISLYAFISQSYNYIIDIMSIYIKARHLYGLEGGVEFRKKFGLLVNDKYIKEINNLNKELIQMKIDYYFASKQVEYINNDNDVNKYFYKQYLKNKKNNII